MRFVINVWFSRDREPYKWASWYAYRDGDGYAVSFGTRGYCYPQDFAADEVGKVLAALATELGGQVYSFVVQPAFDHDAPQDREGDALNGCPGDVAARDSF